MAYKSYLYKAYKGSFYHDASVQVKAAFLNGDSVSLLGDSNAKLGFEVINHDMNPMLKNDKN